MAVLLLFHQSLSILNVARRLIWMIIFCYQCLQYYRILNKSYQPHYEKTVSSMTSAGPSGGDYILLKGNQSFFLTNWGKWSPGGRDVHSLFYIQCKDFIVKFVEISELFQLWDTISDFIQKMSKCKENKSRVVHFTDTWYAQSLLKSANG